ncbi:MAG TPA: hypothetical protein VMW83_07320 [Spirochaetia bacterium]|nr:hypothetical protein [Spirochaetia bacterium]
MLLMVGIGAVFLVLHIVTALRFTPLMPERMVTHWGPTAGGLGPNGWMSKRWGLRLGAILSLVLSAVNLSVGSQPAMGIYVTMGVTQIVVYLVFVWMLVQNAKISKNNQGE